MNVVRRHGPIQLSHRVSKGSETARSREIAGTGRALFDRIRLPSQPEPHQRSWAPAVTIQLPNFPAKYEPS